MIALKGVYDGKKIEFLEPIPKQQARKRSLVAVTFLEEEKVPRSTKHAAKELVEGKLLPLDEVLR
jgi:hypothetical protein